MGFWSRGAFAPGYFTPGYYGPDGGGVEPPLEMPHPVGAGAALARPKPKAKRFTRRLEIVAAVEIDRALPLEVLRILVAEPAASLQWAVTPTAVRLAVIVAAEDSERAVEPRLTRHVAISSGGSEESPHGSLRWVVTGDTAQETGHASIDDNGE